MPTRVLVVDDEPAARERIIELLAGRQEVVVAGQCGDVAAAAAAIRELQPDLVFLDVSMPGPDGFALLAASSHGRMPAVIFVTAYEEHALRAFDVEAVDYLLKPFSVERFELALQRGCEESRRRCEDLLSDRVQRLLTGLEPPRYLERIVLRRTGKIRFLAVQDIDWIDAVADEVRLNVGGVAQSLRSSIGELEAQLDPQRFARIHRSTIVNLERVRELLVSPHGDYVAVLTTGNQLAVGRTYRDRFHESLQTRRRRTDGS
jgi:two-component system, LytTR family, response regulator